MVEGKAKTEKSGYSMFWMLESVGCRELPSHGDRRIYLSIVQKKKKKFLGGAHEAS